MSGRFALVIGNSSYAHAPELLNPCIDAQAFGEKLKTLGFSVTTDTDLVNNQMEDILVRFYRDIRVAAAVECIRGDAGQKQARQDKVKKIFADNNHPLAIPTGDKYSISIQTINRFSKSAGTTFRAGIESITNALAAVFLMHIGDAPGDTGTIRKCSDVRSSNHYRSESGSVVCNAVS